MTRFAAFFSIVVLTGSTQAGVVLFDPPVQEFHIDALPERVSFDLRIVAEELSNDGGVTHEFSSLFLFLRTNFPFPVPEQPFSLPIVEFNYADDFLGRAALAYDPFFCGFAWCSWVSGGVASQSFMSPQKLGTVVVDLTGLSEVRDYPIRVGTDGRSTIDFGDESELLEGLGLVRITPEPATALLLLAGMLALTRRSTTISWK